MKVAPSARTLPPWRSAVARTMARPSPEPGGRVGPSRAPEALERVGRVVVAQPRALVAHGHERASPVLAHVDRHPSTLRAVDERVLDEVADGARRAPPHRRATVTGPGASTTTRPPARASASSVEAHRREGAGAGRVLARQREQVAEQAREARRVALDVRQHVRIGAVLGDVGGIAAQRRERGAQLVRGVGDEAALGLARALERREHRVERLGERADLVARRRPEAAAASRRPSRRSRARRRRGRSAGGARGASAPARSRSRAAPPPRRRTPPARAACARPARPPRCRSRPARHRRRPARRRRSRAARCRGARARRRGASSRSRRGRSRSRARSAPASRAGRRRAMRSAPRRARACRRPRRAAGARPGGPRGHPAPSGAREPTRSAARPASRPRAARRRGTTPPRAPRGRPP